MLGHIHRMLAYIDSGYPLVSFAWRISHPFACHHNANIICGPKSTLYFGEKIHHARSLWRGLDSRLFGSPLTEKHEQRTCPQSGGFVFYLFLCSGSTRHRRKAARNPYAHRKTIYAICNSECDLLGMLSIWGCRSQFFSANISISPSWVLTILQIEICLLAINVLLPFIPQSLIRVSQKRSRNSTGT